MPTIVAPLSVATLPHPKLDPRLAALVELDDAVFAPIDPTAVRLPAPSSGAESLRGGRPRATQRRAGPLAFLTGPRPREHKIGSPDEHVESARFSFVPVFITAAHEEALERIGLRVGILAWRSRAGRIATGEVSLQQLCELEKDDEVEAIEWTGGAKPLGGADACRGVSPRAAVGLTPGVAELDGTGVVVGIVDIEGIDIYHPDFSTDRGAMRILALWDQTVQRAEGELGARPPGFGYGIEYSRGDLWAELEPGYRERYGRVAHRPLKISHGTMVAGIAAGGGVEDPDARGVAPAADIVFVSTRASGAGAFAAMTEVAEAVRYVVTKAGDRPCVVNVSLGDDLGPRDGTSPVERFFDAACAERPGLSIVVAAGNSNEDKTHVCGVCSADSGPFTLVCAAGRPSARHAVIEIWYDAVPDGEAGISLDLTSPDGCFRTGTIAPDGLPRAFDLGETRVLIASTKRYPSGSGAPESDNALLRIEMFPREEGGVIEVGDHAIRLFGDGVRRAFHAWIDHTCFKLRADSPGGERPPPITLTSPGTARSAVVVGACGDTTSRPAAFGGCGPGRHTVDKPDVLACGIGLRAPSAVTVERSYPAFTGTSAAAPLVTGVIALMFQHAARRGERLTTEQTRRLLRCAARERASAEALSAGGPLRLWLDPHADLEGLFQRAEIGGPRGPDEPSAQVFSATTSGEAGAITRRREENAMNTTVDVRGAQTEKDHVRERDGQQLGTGLFGLFQAGIDVGRVLVVDDGTDKVEHWELGPTFRQPSWANRTQDLQFVYTGEAIPLADFRATIGTRSTYIVARCTQATP
jgi:subtilisin family serine protease